VTPVVAVRSLGKWLASRYGVNPALLHESVDGEWSFIETLRHLAFAGDAWVRRGILGDPAPWHPLDLPWNEMPETPGSPAAATSGPRSTMPSPCLGAGWLRFVSWSTG
jgi:hypothetical protein